jgi:hypothetical protein
MISAFLIKMSRATEDNDAESFSFRARLFPRVYSMSLLIRKNSNGYSTGLPRLSSTIGIDTCSHIHTLSQIQQGTIQ